MAKKTVYIQLTSALVFGGEIKRAGTVVECNDAQAKDLLHRGRGKLAEGAGDEGSDEKPLAEHSVPELKEIAAELEISGYAKMQKPALIAAIEAAEAAEDE